MDGNLIRVNAEDAELRTYYTIERLDLDDRGVVTAFDGSVEHRCGDEPDGKSA